MNGVEKILRTTAQPISTAENGKNKLERKNERKTEKEYNTKQAIALN